MMQAVREASRVPRGSGTVRFGFGFVAASILLPAVPLVSRNPGYPISRTVETHAQARIDGHVEKAVLLFQPKPNYPLEAQKAGIQGSLALGPLETEDKLKAGR